MARDIAACNSAIRKAWEKERELVLAGKGTRNWTPQQCEDIIIKGKAYDDEGKAFHGQHMKCVQEHPDYQGDFNNIQLLSPKEHLEAHKGDWKTPTNWYFNPETKEFFSFDDNDYNLFPPTVTLTPSISVLEEAYIEQTKPAEKTEPKITSVKSCGGSEKATSSKTDTAKTKQSEEKTSFFIRAKGAINKVGSKVVAGTKTAVTWSVKHKKEIGAATTCIGTAVTAFVKAYNNCSGSERKNSSNSHTTSSKSSANDKHSNISNERVSQQVCDKNDDYSIRSSPREHEVSKHSQRYHERSYTYRR